MWEIAETKKYNEAYKRGYFPTNALKFFKKEICEFVQKSINGPTKLLDVGCGPCFVRDIGKKYDIDVHGLDITHALIHYWEALKIKAVVGCSDNIPYKDNTFDIVMAWDIMEHIPEEGVEDTFSEIKRVAKRKGLFSFNICLTEEVKKFKGFQFHVTIRPFDWWAKKIEDAGFEIIGSWMLDKGMTHLLGKTLVNK